MIANWVSFFLYILGEFEFEFEFERFIFPSGLRGPLEDSTTMFSMAILFYPEGLTSQID